MLRTFHVDHDKWERFGEVTTAQGTSRAAELRKLIDRHIADSEMQAAA